MAKDNEEAVKVNILQYKEDKAPKDPKGVEYDGEQIKVDIEGHKNFKDSGDDPKPYAGNL